jgi:hypothetical protein
MAFATRQVYVWPTLRLMNTRTLAPRILDVQPGSVFALQRLGQLGAVCNERVVPRFHRQELVQISVAVLQVRNEIQEDVG